MTERERAISILSLCCILILSLPSAGQGDVEQLRAYTISGHVGLPGVRLEGLPKSGVSDASGHYAVHVESGWSGTVTPIKEGYTFTPPSRAYTHVNTDLVDDDYVATAVKFTISGHVGLPDVRLEGLPGSVMSDGAGNYVAEVDFGWVGTVRPRKEGYGFDPPSTAYFGVEENESSQDYVGHPMACNIAGRVGMAGVTLRGLPTSPLSDENGIYSARVPYGWSGVVVPEKDGYEFVPERRKYSSVQEDRGDQNYTATIRMVTISDVVAFGDRPLPGVTVTTGDGGDQALTDITGRYVIEVPYGWTGSLTLSKPGLAFAPSTFPYANLTTHVVDGERYPASEPPPIPQAAPAVVRPRVSVAGAGVVVIPTAPIDLVVLGQIKEDMGIMLQILRDKLSEPRTILGTLYDFGDFFDSDGGAEALYLQGYGTVFVMKVSFPLTPTVSADGSTSELENDPIWQRARQRLYTPGGVPGRSGAIQVPTDPESFQRFQDDMVGMLKHAANIRHLAVDESVVLTIISQAGQPAGAFGQTSRSLYGGGGSYSGGFVSGGISGGGSMSTQGGSYSSFRSFGGVNVSSPGQAVTGAAPAESTVLTITASKGDIDAFAQGDVTPEQFRARVKILTY